MTIQAPSSPRLTFIDATKGGLVILMVLYHSLNYSSEYYLGFRYLSFLPPSFIVISGLLISHVYLNRYEPFDSALHSKLLWRGLKLLLLFTGLNVAVAYVKGPYQGFVPIGLYRFLDSWIQVFVVGTGRTAVFEVLLPIAYLLLMAPILIILNSLHRFALPCCALLVVFACIIIERAGGSGNLNFLSAGVIGFWIGKRLPSSEQLARSWFLGLTLFLGSFVVGMTLGHNYLVQLVGAVIALWAIGSTNARWEYSRFPREIINRLGQYSLLAYIAQIFLLQALSYFLPRPIPWSPRFFLLLISCLFMTTAVVETAHLMRRRSRIFNWLYTVVLP